MLKLVIEIPENEYGLIKEIYEKNDIVESTYSYIYHGTPLPKGHGRLIAEPTEEEIAKTVGGQNDFAECIRDSVKAVFDNAQTIIEADGGGEDENNG